MLKFDISMYTQEILGKLLYINCIQDFIWFYWFVCVYLTNNLH